MRDSLTFSFRCAVLAAGILTVVEPESAWSQTLGLGGLPSQQRLLEEQLRPLIAPNLRTPSQQERFQYDYGAVVSYTGLWFEDHGPAALGDFQRSRAVHQWDLRPWMSFDYDGVHRGFVRGQLDYLNYHDGDSYGRGSDWKGPFIDIGFYQLDVDEALRRYAGDDNDVWSADFSIGRQFLFIGRGLSFALTTDAVSLDWQRQDWGGLLFGSQSIAHNDNIDTSVPGFDRSQREFFGGQLEYQGFDHHELYGYVVVQRDRSSESPDDPLQEFDYDSEYWGIGADGELMFGEPESVVGMQDVRYFAEFVLQRGRSFGRGATAGQDAIHAWSVDAGLIYYMNAPQRPRFLIEYARANGDADRISPQNTRAGNLPGTTDNGFLGFGFLNTGVNFAPLFANLEFVRLGAALRPFDHACNPGLRDLEVGTSAFFYRRAEANGGVSDIRADIAGGKSLGTEWDLFVNWRVSSDVLLLLNYGIFTPDSDSFSDDRSRQFVSLNLSWLL